MRIVRREVTSLFTPAMKQYDGFPLYGRPMKIEIGSMSKEEWNDDMPFHGFPMEEADTEDFDEMMEQRLEGDQGEGALPEIVVRNKGGQSMETAADSEEDDDDDQEEEEEEDTLIDLHVLEASGGAYVSHTLLKIIDKEFRRRNASESSKLSITWW